MRQIDERQRSVRRHLSDVLGDAFPSSLVDSLFDALADHGLRKLERACELVRLELERGPVESRELERRVLEHSRQYGPRIGAITVRRARKLLGVVAFQDRQSVPWRWMCRLPDRPAAKCGCWRAKAYDRL